MSLPIFTAIAAAATTPGTVGEADMPAIAQNTVPYTSELAASSILNSGAIVSAEVVTAARGAAQGPQIRADIVGVMAFEGAQTVQPTAAPTSAPTAEVDEAPSLGGDIINTASPDEGEGNDVEVSEQDDGTIVVTAGLGPPPGDPLIKLNEETFEVTQKIDEKFVEPVAETYESGLPGPVRDGLSNFFNNVREPIAFVNYVLQGNPGRAAATLGRFAINSTVGIAGLIDVAEKKPFNLERTNNGFANTLGYYGVEPGAFLILPGIGSTTVRDLVGNSLDALSLATVIGVGPAGQIFRHPGFVASSYTVRSLDERIAFRDRINATREADYPYTTLRETYLCNRKAEIAALKGRTITADECGEEAILPEGVLPSPQPVAPVAAPAIEMPPPAPVEPVIEFYSEPVVQPLG